MLKKFVVKLVLFSLPLMLCSLGTIWIGLQFGDLRPMSQIIALQVANNGIYQVNGSQQEIIHYKLQMALHRQADFLVLGSSRFYFVTQDFVSNPESTFYNATVPGLPPANALDMLQVLAEHDAMPEIVFINLDLAWFNADRVDKESFPDWVTPPNASTEITRLVQSFNDLSRDLLIRPQTVWMQLSALNANDSEFFIGRDTHTRGQLDRTFRVDGSIVRPISPEFARAGIEASQTAFDESNRIFEVGSTVDDSALSAIEEMIALAQAHDTMIVAILPPYYPEFYEALQISPQHSYMNIARERIAALFVDSGMIFHDFTDASATHVETDMFYDGWHLGELGTLTLYLDVLNANPDVLSLYSDADTISDLLANAVSPYHLH